jgi:ornithine cyclodeaminase
MVAAAVGGTVVDSLSDAVSEADVISTAAMSADPLVEGRWIRRGTHLDLVGAFQPDHREVDDDAVVRAELYVDHREATLTEDGDLVIPLRAGLITPDDVRGDLYELCRGHVAGRTDAHTITLFENGGGGHLDLMTAAFAWRRHQEGR